MTGPSVHDGMPRDLGGVHGAQLTQTFRAQHFRRAVHRHPCNGQYVANDLDGDVQQFPFQIAAVAAGVVGLLLLGLLFGHVALNQQFQFPQRRMP